MSTKIQKRKLKFTEDELLEIENASSNIKVQGARFPEHLQKFVGL